MPMTLPCLYVMQHPLLAFEAQTLHDHLFMLLDNSFQNSTEVRVTLIHVLGLHTKVPLGFFA